MENIPQMIVNVKYLDSISHSHDSVFSAFAELIDNAHDAQANHLFIDHKKNK